VVGKTAAALRMPELEEQGKVRRQRVVRRQVRRRLEPLMAYGLFVAVAVGLVLLYVAQYAYVTQLNLRLSRAEYALAEIETLNEQLQQEAASLKSLRRVEQEAVTRLGMQKPELVRTVRAPLDRTFEEVVASDPGESLSPPALSNHQPNRLLAFLNWTRGLKRAWAKGVEEYH
jgi:cell division protein FtsL